MTDFLLALIPTYGLWVIFFSVILSSLAVPIPSSLMVMAAGGFAAAGDFKFEELIGFALVGFVIGDQALFFVSRILGQPFIDRLSRKPKTAEVINRVYTLIERRGLIAVFLTRTLLSPLGPYVATLSGAMKHSWLKFTIPALAGAAVWTMGFASLGFTFADQISQVASLIRGSIGIVVAGTAVIIGIIFLYRSFANHQQQSDAS